MASQPDTSNPTPDDKSLCLRRQTEQSTEINAGESIEMLSGEEVGRLLQDLRIHQIELEMQNEELRRTQQMLLASQARYFELYDLAPVGYLTLDERSVIQEANLTAATLLGTTRQGLKNARFTQFVVNADQDDYYRHRQQLFDHGEPQQFEVRLLRADDSFFWARVHALPVPCEGDGAALCRLTLSDISEAKRHEAAMRLSARTVAAANDAILTTDNDAAFTITSWNAGAEKIYGWTAAEAIGRSSQIFQNEYPDGNREEILKTILANGQFAGEVIQSRKDGSRIAIDARLIATRNQDHAITGWICVNRDITERKRNELALQHSEARFRRQFESTPIPTFVWSVEDEQIVLIDANTAADTLTNNTARQFLGMSAAELYPDRPDLLAKFRECLERRTTIRYETPYHHRGTQKDRIIAFTFAFVTPTLLILHADDVTERRQAVEQLQASEHKYRMLMENLAEGIWYIDQDAMTTFVNQPMAAMLGYTVEEMMGKHLFAFMDEQGVEIATRNLAARRAGVSERHEFEFLRKDGARVYASLATGPILDEQGRYIGAIAAVQDITDRLRAEAEHNALRERLAEAEKLEMVGRLAGGVAHDFNNMLAVILMRAELGMQEVDLGARSRRHLAEINKTAQRSAALVRQLLGFARKQLIAPRVLDLNATVDGMLAMLHQLLGEEIDLDFRPGVDLWRVKMDPSQIDQILVNLCVNARDAISAIGRVEIATANVTIEYENQEAEHDVIPGDYVRLSVTDSGCGIEPAVVEHIFEPFFTTKPVGKGTGLGLATVYGIVKQNHGEIQASSEAGGGATFTIYLPRYNDVAAQEPGVEVHSLPAGRGETVLLVEDRAELLNSTAEALRHLGYVVTATHLPAEAESRASSGSTRFDLLVTDIIMPLIDGSELAARIRAQQPWIKCLYISGYPAEFIANRGLIDANIQFLQKPFTLAALAEKIRVTLDSPA